MISDAPHVHETGRLPRLTDRERRRAVATGPVGDPGRYLAVESGDEVVVIALTDAVTRIGRSLSSDVTLEDAGVSRRQALVVERDGGHVLLDDRSRHGTWLNGRRVTEAPLADGDEIAVGAVRIRYLDVR